MRARASAAGLGGHLLTLTTLACSILLAASGPAAAPADCRIGTYRLRGGGDVDIGPAAGGRLIWRKKDGTVGRLEGAAGGDGWTSTLGWTERPDGKRVSFPDCERGLVDFDGVPGRRIDLDVVETRFQGAGVTLAGRLVLPRGTGRVPIAVLIHGSEHDAALDRYALQRLFPSEGIGAFVYDKRGTGASGGTYTQDFLTLADDAIAALREARRLAGPRAGRMGYQGGSQGGWVAPLAARIEPVDFVIVGFGLAVSPLEEDRSAIRLDMTRRGYGPEVMARAMEVADAVAAVLESGFREGYDRVDAVRQKYGAEPWFKDVHGNVAFLVLEKPPAQLRELGLVLFRGCPLHHDPMPVLRNLATPQLWILGEDDLDAPSAETIRRLRGLAADGAPITTAVFPRAGHGIYEYEIGPDGSQVSTRQPDGYFAMMRDFILRGRLEVRYGSSTLYRPAGGQEARPASPGRP